jgi:hypothetical protein
MGLLDALRLGRSLIAKPVARFSTATAGAWGARDGVLAAHVLRRFTVISDYQRSRIILEPNRHFAEPF